MADETLFTQEFSQQLANYLATSDHVTTKIQLAQKTDGQLTRLFDQMVISQAASVNAYQRARNAADIEQHLQDIVLETAKVLFNADMTDLNADMIQSMGTDNYQGLLAASGGKEAMVDHLMRAAVASYSQVITTGLDSEIAALDYASKNARKIEFTDKVSAPMERYIASISKAKLLNPQNQLGESVDSVLRRTNELKASLFQAYTTLKQYQNQLKTRLLGGETSDTVNQQNIDAIILCTNALNAIDGMLDVEIEKLEQSPTQTNAEIALQKIATVCERIQQRVLPSLVAIKAAPEVKSIGELILNAIVRFLTLSFVGYKSTATISQQNNSAERAVLPTKLQSIIATHDMKQQLNDDRENEEPESAPLIPGPH